MESKKINQLATAVSPSTSDLAIIGDPVTGVSKKITWLQVSTLIGTAANLQQVTDNGATTTNPIAIGGLTITGLSTGVLKSDSGVISSVPFGAANGVATLAGDGKVPSNQLPSYVDDVVEVANYAALPVTGETGKIYITLDNNKVYRWGGSVYVEVAANQAVWGSITGTLANQTDLQNVLDLKATDSLVVHLAGTETITGTKTFSNPSKNDGGILLKNGASYSLSGYMNLGGMTDGLRFTSGGGISNYFALPSSVGYTYTFPAASGTIALTSDIPILTGYVPYTGATANVDLGTFNLTADVITGATGSFASNGGSNTFAINHSSGAGIALNITKGGNGEGLYINKTSGSGNAATIIGTLNATTLVKSGGTSSQFLKADGSVDASAYITLASLSAVSPLSYNNSTGAFSIQVATASQNGYLSSTDWSTFNNKQAALGGTGFVKISGSTISYDNSTYYLASNPSGFITLASLSAGDGISYSNTTGVISSTITQYTDALARAAISSSATGLTYTSATGVFSLTAGYSIPTTAKQTEWDTAYTNRITSLTTTGTSGVATLVSNTLNIPNYTYTLPTASTSVLGGVKVDGTTITINGSGVISGANTYSLPIATSSVLGGVKIGSGVSVDVNGVISVSTNYQAPITLTTTGTSGSATFISGTLNIPAYTLSGLGGQPLDDDLTAIAALNTTNFGRGFLTLNDAAEGRAKINAQEVLTNPVTGTGTSGYVAFFNGTSSIAGESNLFWDASNNRLQVGSVSSTYGITSIDGLQVGDGSGSAINFNSNSGYQAYIRVAGNDRITIVSTTGRVGINTNNVNASLEVKSTIANEGSLRLYNTINNAATTWGLEWFRDYDSASNSEAAYIKYKREGGSSGSLIFGAGSVGSISTALTINGSRNVAIGTDTATAKLQISNTSAGAASVAAFLVNESATANTEVRLAFAAHTNVDIATNRYAYISALNTSNSNGQALIFATNTSGNSAVQRLRIAADGKIGVNCDPSFRFQVEESISTAYTGSNIDTYSNLYIRNTSTTAGVAAILTFNAEGVANSSVASIGVINTSSGSGSFFIGTRNASGTTDERFRVAPNGFVGINNSSPFARLTIDSNIGSARSFSSSDIPNIFLRDTTTSAANVGGAITFAGYKSAAGATGLFATISGQKENGTDGNELGSFVVYTSYTSGGAFRESFRIKSDGVINSNANYGGGGNRVIYTDNTGNFIAASVGTGLSLSGGVLSATGGASGSISGSGNSGYIPKFTGTASIGNSQLYDDGTSIILGNTSASAGFKVTAWAASASNTTAIGSWPYWDTGTQTMTRKIMSFNDGGNGGTSTAGTGTTAYIEIGQYYTGRGVITMSGSGGASPSDQGTGRGKDLMVIAGSSDNGTGYLGGRLYLQGGSGYSGGYNANFGDVIISQLGGNVSIGYSAPSYKLDVNGDIRAGGNLRATGSGSGLYLSGGSNRIYFTNYRAIEGSIDGAILQIGEQYTETRVYNTLSVDGNSVDKPQFNINGLNYPIIKMGDRTSGTTDVGYLRMYNANVIRIDLNTETSAFSYINAGNVVIGSNAEVSSIYKFQVTGKIYATDDIIAFSDISVKNNIRNIDNALERVTKSRGVIYDRKDINSINNIGFIAQELEEQFPELISVNDDGTKGVKYQNAVAILFEAIKEQQKQIDGLKKQVA